VFRHSRECCNPHRVGQPLVAGGCRESECRRRPWLVVSALELTHEQHRVDPHDGLGLLVAGQRRHELRDQQRNFTVGLFVGQVAEQQVADAPARPLDQGAIFVERELRQGRLLEKQPRIRIDLPALAQLLLEFTNLAAGLHLRPADILWLRPGRSGCTHRGGHCGGEEGDRAAAAAWMGHGDQRLKGLPNGLSGLGPWGRLSLLPLASSTIGSVPT
jgi:hypothetical protein